MPVRSTSHSIHAAVVQTLESRRLLSSPTSGLESIAPSTPHAADRVWTSLDTLPAAPTGKRTELNLADFEPFALNATELKRRLARAPDEDVAAGLYRSLEGALEISIPTPEGKLARFNIVESSIMEPGLAARFPDIKTYAGIGVDDPAASIRLDFTYQGFHAQVISTGKTFYVDPYYHLDQGVYASYYRRDARMSAQRAAAMGIDHDIHDDHSHEFLDPGTSNPNTVNRTGTQLRTYRTAVAAIGEYTAFHGGTVALGQSAVVTAMNRVNQVYELDLTIRMTLVANNSLLIYTNAATDPYSNSTASINQNQTNVDAVIGNANYDIGHVFTTGSGGLAGLGVLGLTGQKARGTTGLPSPVGDPFVIDFVAHELGHQFGGNHTFNTSSDPNRAPSAAYEPGSGSTIMAYAGITGANSDLQPNSDPYFLFHSFDEIIQLVDVTRPGVGTRTATGNSVPTSNAGANFVIPANTPFSLTGAGTDANGDTLTYCWEQRDLGPAQLLNQADNGSSPLFRSRTPTTNPTRLFPRLQTILAGNLTDNLGEKLPSTSRSLNFRLTVRDNRAGGGGVNTDDMFITVVNNGAGFAISNLNAAATLNSGAGQTITWNLAGSNTGSINVANVMISMSTDGGNTFPTVLAASTANDGSESVTIPSVISNQVRFKVEAVGNIFFDINNANLTIQPVGGVSATPDQPSLAAASDTGTSSFDNITRLNNSSAASVLQFNVTNTVAGAQVQIYSDGTLIGQATASGASTTVTTNGSVALANGLRNITARQTETGKAQSPDSAVRSITVDATAPIATLLVFNRDTAPHQVRYSFNEDVGPTIGAGSLAISNISGGASAGTPSSSYSFGTATFTFPSRPSGILDRGNYSVSLNASVTDIAGNSVGASAGTFFFLPGDATGDRVVNISDFALLSARFNQSGTFSQGNFNYTGLIDIGDFSILAANFNASLPMPASLPRAASALPPLKMGSLFANERIESMADQVI